MISKVIRVARVGSRTELAAAALMLISYPCLLVAALLPSAGFFAVATAVGYLADRSLHQRRSYLVNRLALLGVGLPARFLVRELTVLLLLARLGLGGTAVFASAVVAFVVFYGLQAPHGALLTLIGNRRRLPYMTRNIDLSRLRIPDAPPRRLVARGQEKMLHLDVFAMAGLLAYAHVETAAYAWTGLAVTIGLALLYVLLVAPYLLLKRRLPAGRPKALAFIDTWLREYRPTTVLYFSGSPDSAYQVNMWLTTMEQLKERPLVILREEVILSKLAPTDLPVLCVPGAVHLMNMDLSSVRVALYPANVGKNIHLLRVPTIKHVFVGHGDSDKIASVNPFSKVYDEVWTAGRAGRDRYALAEVGVRDEDIVEVGRPQLDPIRTWDGAAPDGIPTVLYAPTWEGWTDDPGNTSLILAGVNIVRGLLESEPPVRVLYKPHPFTGTVDKRAKAAHRKITALVEQAAAARRADPAWAARTGAGPDADARAAARAEVARLDAEIAALAAGPGARGDDEAVASRDALTDPAAGERLARLRVERDTAYWASIAPWEHTVVTGPAPHLYDCFNQSDAMVSDISSVVSDFVATRKPYAITDSAGLGEQEFMRQNTAARAALILDNSAARVGELVAAVVRPEQDPLADARREIREYLLGPDEPASIERFGQAARELAGRADSRIARLAALQIDLAPEDDEGARADGPEGADASDAEEASEAREEAGAA
ncbi:hypothetical protein [Streptomyces sp. NRRL F-5123]|uniref:hypothetical protein n=1 Tax=Streptomyces sp. NRRL F-5123 TaxID=1463856 RepID=UPI0007C4B109|nr:hypothetical protein [Streptomyces sp. NRRL F-5123]